MPSAYKVECAMKKRLRTLPLALITLAACAAPLGAAPDDVRTQSAGFQLQPGIIICADVMFGERFWERAIQVAPRTASSQANFGNGLLSYLVPILRPHLSGNPLRPGQPAISGYSTNLSDPLCSSESLAMRVRVEYNLDDAASLLTIHYTVEQGAVLEESRRVLSREKIWQSGRYAAGYGRNPWAHTISRDMEVSAEHVAGLILNGE
jgi:hypothetical protein